MEVLIITLIWFFLFYQVKIHRALYNYRKHYNRHNDIYVPSLEERNVKTDELKNEFKAALNNVLNLLTSLLKRINLRLERNGL